MRKQKIKKLVKHSEVKSPPINETFAELNSLAHAGTKEAIIKLRKFIASEKNEDLRGYAECALDEAEFFYYSPQNEKEEKEFRLAKIIWRRENNLFDRQAKLGAAKLELEELDLDREINQKVCRKLNNAELKKIGSIILARIITKWCKIDFWSCKTKSLMKKLGLMRREKC